MCGGKSSQGPKVISQGPEDTMAEEHWLSVSSGVHALLNFVHIQWSLGPSKDFTP